MKLTITSCRTLRVASDILSNSSIQQTPPSLSTSAPLKQVSDGAQNYNYMNTYLSKTNCFESGSRVTYAVKPTADEPFPEVYTPLGAILCTYCSPRLVMQDTLCRMSAYPQYLRLARTRVSYKQDVDVTAVPRATCAATPRNALVRPSKQLE